MAVLLVVLCCLFFLGALFALDEDLYHFYLRGNDKYSLEWLEQHTGIFGRGRIEKLVGPRRPDRLYVVPAVRLESLPRNRWVRGPYHPLLNVAAMIGLVMAIVQGSWLLFAISGGYLALILAWGVYWYRRSCAESDVELPEFDPSTSVEVIERDLHVRLLLIVEDASLTPLQKFLFRENKPPPSENDVAALKTIRMEFLRLRARIREDGGDPRDLERIEQNLQDLDRVLIPSRAAAAQRRVERHGAVEEAGEG